MSKYKSLTQRINEGFAYEAKDWGTGEISNENDLIKAIVSASKKSADFAKSLLKSMKSEKIDKTANVVVEANDWGTGEITDNNSLIKAAVSASKKSKELAKKILSALKDLNLKGIAIAESEDEDDTEVVEKKRSKKKNECGDEDEMNEDEEEEEVNESKKRNKRKNEDEEEEETNEDEEEEDVTENKRRSKRKNESKRRSKRKNEDEEEEDDVNEDDDAEFSEDDVNEAVDQFGEFVELDEKAKAKLKKKVMETAGKKLGKTAKKGLSKAKGFVSSLYHDKHY